MLLTECGIIGRLKQLKLWIHLVRDITRNRCVSKRDSESVREARTCTTRPLKGVLNVALLIPIDELFGEKKTPCHSGPQGLRRETLFGGGHYFFRFSKSCIVE